MFAIADCVAGGVESIYSTMCAILKKVSQQADK
jgi:hypothetical protein